jgi:hypothetical protein
MIRRIADIALGLIAGGLIGWGGSSLALDYWNNHCWR